MVIDFTQYRQKLEELRPRTITFHALPLSITLTVENGDTKGVLDVIAAQGYVSAEIDGALHFIPYPCPLSIRDA